MKNTIKKIKYKIHLNPLNADNILEEIEKNHKHKKLNINEAFERETGCNITEYAHHTEQVLNEIGTGDVVNVLSRTFVGKDIIKKHQTPILKMGIISRTFDRIRARLNLGDIGIEGQIKAQTRKSMRQEFNKVNRAWIRFREKTVSKKNIVEHLVNFLNSKLNPVNILPQAISEVSKKTGFKKKVFDDKTTEEFFKHVLARNFEIKHQPEIERENKELQIKKQKLEQQIVKNPENKKVADELITAVKDADNTKVSEIIELLKKMPQDRRDLVTSYAQSMQW